MSLCIRVLNSHWFYNWIAYKESWQLFWIKTLNSVEYLKTLSQNDSFRMPWREGEGQLNQFYACELTQAGSACKYFPHSCLFMPLKSSMTWNPVIFYHVDPLLDCCIWPGCVNTLSRMGNVRQANEGRLFQPGTCKMSKDYLSLMSQPLQCDVFPKHGFDFAMYSLTRVLATCWIC